MTLKTAALLALIGMALLTAVLAVVFIRDLSALSAGAIAPVTLSNALVHLFASLTMTIFLFVFHRVQS